MSVTRRKRFVKTIALLAYFVTALMVVLGFAQAQNNNRSKGYALAPGTWME